MVDLFQKMENSNKPGGSKAVANGCLCNPKDNCYGLGYKTDEKCRARYWVSNFCPLHGSYKINK